MNYQAIGVVLGLMALGAGLIAWPLVLVANGLREALSRAEATIVDLRLALSRAVAQADVQVKSEQEIDSARDLPHADELRMLLGSGHDPAPKPSAGP